MRLVARGFQKKDKPKSDRKIVSYSNKIVAFQIKGDDWWQGHLLYIHKVVQLQGAAFTDMDNFLIAGTDEFLKMILTGSSETPPMFKIKRGTSLTFVSYNVCQSDHGRCRQ